MDVILEPNRGNPFYIEVGYFDSVLEIKDKIQKEHGIPVWKQTLVFKGSVLEDDVNVHRSEIVERSRIQLVVEDQTRIQLLVKMAGSKVSTGVEMEMSESILRLKEKIQDMESIPVSRLVINWNGRELQDEKSLEECEVWDNCEMEVTVRSNRKMRINVASGTADQKIGVEVNGGDNVGELRKRLHHIKLPEEGYFFIYKQNVMDDDRSFRWHHVAHGDTIEIFSGTVSAPTS